MQARKIHKLSVDALVSFEGRQYSVPFGFVGQTVEIQGTARTVQVLAEGRVVAEHPRHTDARLVLASDHYEGPDTERVKAPTPLGRLGRRLQELASMPVEQRPVDLYADLAEAVR